MTMWHEELIEKYGKNAAGLPDVACVVCDGMLKAICITTYSYCCERCGLLYAQLPTPEAIKMVRERRIKMNQK